MPRNGWYRPSSHNSHRDMPTSGATLPASHSTHALELGAAAKRPAGHSVHALASCPPLKLLYVPAGHACAVAFVLPSGQKCPIAHAPSHWPSLRRGTEPKRPAEQR
eukprot:1825489-Pleurochrysis_carterae.AAC.4